MEGCKRLWIAGVDYRHQRHEVLQPEQVEDSYMHHKRRLCLLPSLAFHASNTFSVLGMALNIGLQKSTQSLGASSLTSYFAAVRSLRSWPNASWKTYARIALPT